MGWQTLHKPSYDTDFVGLNKGLQRAVINGLRDLERDPVTPRGNTIKPLKGYDNLWRYRLGDFRLIYAAQPQAKLLQLLAIGPRGRVYKRFNYPGWDAPEAAVEFGPKLADQPEWMNHPEWMQPKGAQKEKLPRKLTPALLAKWRIDNQYYPALIPCRYEDELYELMSAAESTVPYEVFERVIDGLYPPNVDRIASQPDQMLFDYEDLARYADGTLAGFLLHLDEQQLPLTNWALSGPTLVKGGPGSGKSTVALYRLRAIVEAALKNEGYLPQIMFTTYTNSLINSSESLLWQLLQEPLGLDADQRLPKQIRVTTLHKTAIWIARASGEKFNIAGEDQCKAAIRAARASLQPRDLGDVAKIPIANILAKYRDDYLLAEFDWVIEGQNCQTEADYLGATRTGRGIAFAKATRKAVWAIYEAYHEQLMNQGLYSWGHLMRFALQQVRAGHFRRRWEYVLVDEAQDLPPVALALCVELCRMPAGVFLTADANQSLYNRGFRWGNVHDQLQVKGRSRILRRNYRSTRQIAAAARQIMENVPEIDREVVMQEYVHSGLSPLIYAASGSGDQAAWIAARVFESARNLRLPLNAAVVLVSSSTVGMPLAAALSRHGLPAKFMRSRDYSLNDPSLKVTTLHAAKGLEFPVVVVAHVEAGLLPRDSDVRDADELATYLQEQRRLFYVGCTRAMRRLFITYDQQVPSPFLTDLTDEYWDWS